MKFNLISLFVGLSLFVISCGGNGIDEGEDTEGQSQIILTHEQFALDQMSFGSLEKTVFEEWIKCNGHLVPKPGGMAFVSTILPGRIERIFVTQGQKVSKGQALFELSGNEMISLQKEYAEAASQLKQVKAEYERVKSLHAENIGAGKDLILAESEYRSVQATYAGLQMKLQLLGLEGKKIEDGQFFSSFISRAPISGYVSQLSISVGQFADQHTTLAEILDMSQLQLQISVFEKDIHRLSQGQEVRFMFMGNPQLTHRARLSAVGKMVEQESKTITCYASLEDPGDALMFSQAYVDIQIITNADTVNALPEESIISSGGSHYVLLIEKEEDTQFFLQKMEVETGRSFNGYIEILSPGELPRLLTKGAYNLYVE